MPRENIELQTLKFYSSLFCRIYRNDEDYDMCDEPEDITMSEAVYYEDEILQRIQQENARLESERGLMEYFHEDAAVKTIVHSAHPSVEVVDGELYGVMICKVTGNLTDTQLELLKSEFTGQYSDGYGEGFEQREIKTDEGKLFVSFWDASNEFYIKTEQEFFKDHSQGMRMGGM